MPDWLCDWIASSTEAAKNIESRDRRSVAENFDMGAFLNHYGLGYQTRGPWYITDVCPIAGRKHEQSSTTGFYYDGLSLGFKCFASSCPGSSMSVGEVIKHLNKSDGTVVVAPYTGEIWPKHEPAIDPEVAGADWFEPLSAFRARPIPRARNSCGITPRRPRSSTARASTRYSPSAASANRSSPSGSSTASRTGGSSCDTRVKAG
jgi:hypothetical protein